MAEIFDIEKIREQYPILQRTVSGKPLIYLDNAATSQVPRCVVEGIEHQMRRRAGEQPIVVHE